MLLAVARGVPRSPFPRHAARPSRCSRSCFVGTTVPRDRPNVAAAATGRRLGCCWKSLTRASGARSPPRPTALAEIIRLIRESSGAGLSVWTIWPATRAFRCRTSRSDSRPKRACRRGSSSCATRSRSAKRILRDQDASVTDLALGPGVRVLAVFRHGVQADHRLDAFGISARRRVAAATAAGSRRARLTAGCPPPDSRSTSPGVAWATHAAVVRASRAGDRGDGCPAGSPGPWVSTGLARAAREPAPTWRVTASRFGR